MALEPGSKLGAYEIHGLLGAGGMGQVYRARDPKLGREVALKVLPEAFASSPDRVASFDREARSLAALNHSRIAAIYGVEEADRTRFLVLELVEGQTLAEILKRRRVPVRDALALCAQIAEGLAAAHERGILHRDLKPSNVVVTPESNVKLLDFGLARGFEPPQPDSAPETSPTVTTPPTPEGGIQGTAAYMSPEQARGEQLDHRTDVWSFGCVAYEVLTGRRAFQAKTFSDTIAAVLEHEPDWSLLPDDTPEAVKRVVRRCLRKERRRRPQNLADAQLELEEVLEEPHVLTPRPAAVDAWHTKMRRGVAALVVAAVFGGGLALGVLGSAPPRSDPPQLTPLTFGRGPVRGARFTPDGQTVVFSAAWGGEPFRLHMKRLSDPEELTFGPDHTQLLGISPAAELLVLLNRRLVSSPFSATGTLGRLPLTGGAPREILDSVETGDWNGAGTAVALVRDTGATRRLELPAGNTLYETAAWLSDLRLAPYAHVAAFVEHPLRESNAGQLVVIDGDGRILRREGEAGQNRVVTGLAWRPDGSELLWSNSEGEVWAAPVRGPARVVLRIPPWAVLHDLSSSGLALVAQDSRRVAAVVGRPGLSFERDLSWLSWSLVGQISLDGRRLLFTEFGLPGAPDGTIALRPLDGSPIVRLGAGFGNSLSPDGRWALASYIPPTARLTLLPTGPGSPHELPRGPIETYDWADFLPDARAIVFAGHEASRPPQLYIQDIEGGPPHPLGSEPIGFGQVFVAPNGLLVAAMGLDRRPRLVSVPDGTARLAPGVLAGEIPAGWSEDSRALFVYMFGEQPTHLRRVDIESGKGTVVAEVMPSDPGGVDSIGPITVTPNGARFAYSYIRTLSQLFLVRGLAER